MSDPPLRFDDEGTLIPPTRPEPALIDDGYYVEPTPVPRRPYRGWEIDEPISHRFAWFGLGICVGVIVFALVFTLGRQLDAASRSGQTTEPVDVSRPSSAALSGVPTPGAPPARTEAPVPSPSAAPTGDSSSREAGWAAWCAPTPKYCHGWAPPAAVGAVRSFTAGDTPYPVRVHRADDPDVYVDVLVVSYCACGIRGEHRTVIDLSPSAFADLVDPGRKPEDLSRLDVGLVLVELEVLDGLQLPRTDTPDQHPEDPPEHDDDRRMRLEVLGDELYR